MLIGFALKGVERLRCVFVFFFAKEDDRLKLFTCRGFKVKDEDSTFMMHHLHILLYKYNISRHMIYINLTRYQCMGLPIDTQSTYQ